MRNSYFLLVAANLSGDKTAQSLELVERIM